MDKDSKIREAYNRAKNVYTKRPETALNTIQATAKIEEGMICKFTQGEHSAVMDMPAIMGGDDAGPTPGFFGRAGIAGCLAMGIKQAAVMEGVVFDTVTVNIETDFNDGASMGVGTASAAPLETRLSILVQTSVPELEVSTLINKVLDTDPWFLALRDAQSVKTDLEVDK